MVAVDPVQAITERDAIDLVGRVKATRPIRRRQGAVRVRQIFVGEEAGRLFRILHDVWR